MNWEYIIAVIIDMVIFTGLGMVFNWLRLKAKGTKWETFLEKVYTFVNAAERMYKSGELDDRLTYVTKSLQTWMNEHNVKLSAEELMAYIKAEVNQLPPTHEDF
jgi:predicted GTPase